MENPYQMLVILVIINKLNKIRNKMSINEVLKDNLIADVKHTIGIDLMSNQRINTQERYI